VGVAWLCFMHVLSMLDFLQEKCIRAPTNLVSLQAYNQPAHVALAKTAAVIALLRKMDTDSVSEWPRRRTKLVPTAAKLVRTDACQTCRTDVVAGKGWCLWLGACGDSCLQVVENLAALVVVLVGGVGARETC
jgi:hypothetical protein